MSIQLRQANKSDIPAILELIKELAHYEKAPHEVTITPEILERDGFGDHPLFWVILAEEYGEELGMSFYYIRYSTWKGTCLYLEDIIVKEQYRGRGIGKLLMDTTIEKAKEMKMALMVWQVLEWNEPAINFYKKYNAEFDSEWLNCKIRF